MTVSKDFNSGEPRRCAIAQIEHFGETTDVEITVLVDNRANMIAKSPDTVKRFVDKPLLSEHGFSALIELKSVGRRILWDAGITPITLLENARRMEVDLKAIDTIALSHGHGDHTAALTDVLEAMEVLPKSRKWPAGTSIDEMRAWAQGRRVPVVAHPAAFRECWVKSKDGSWRGPLMPPPRAEWEAAGAQLVLSEGPYELGPGCWTTGTVPRSSFEKSGIPSSTFYREGDALVRHRIEDDQAVVINVKNKGLVVLSGCAHSGIVNTVNYAREISGLDRVWAVLGGFHLGWSTDDEIRRTVDEMKELAPNMIAPTHCTGFKAIRTFAAQMPETFVLGLVGTKYLF